MYIPAGVPADVAGVNDRPTTKDPVRYLMHSNPVIASAALNVIPAAAISVMVRVDANPPELAFGPQTVNFDSSGIANTPAFRSTKTIDTVHNQEYTFTWYASFDGGLT